MIKKKEEEKKGERWREGREREGRGEGRRRRRKGQLWTHSKKVGNTKPASTLILDFRSFEQFVPALQVKFPRGFGGVDATIKQLLVIWELLGTVPPSAACLHFTACSSA